MPSLHIHREHTLGLLAARKLARQWAEEAQEKFSLACEVLEGDAQDTVEFQRNGVSGTLVVAADHFELHAKLGLLLGPFRQTIENEIREHLDELLGGDVPALHQSAQKKKK
jgi:putative polyhydroxyalkanoate system protein